MLRDHRSLDAPACQHRRHLPGPPPHALPIGVQAHDVVGQLVELPVVRDRDDLRARGPKYSYSAARHRARAGLVSAP